MLSKLLLQLLDRHFATSSSNLNWLASHASTLHCVTQSTVSLEPKSMSWYLLLVSHPISKLSPSFSSSTTVAYQMWFCLQLCKNVWSELSKEPRTLHLAVACLVTFCCTASLELARLSLPRSLHKSRTWTLQS